MYSYTAATLALRAKYSLSFHYLSLPNDQPFCCHHSSCHFSVCPLFLPTYPFPSKTLFNSPRCRLRLFFRTHEPEERFLGSVEPSWRKGRRRAPLDQPANLSQKVNIRESRPDRRSKNVREIEKGESSAFGHQRRVLEKRSKVGDFRCNDTQSVAYPLKDKRIHLDGHAQKQDVCRRSTRRISEVSLSHGSEFERASSIDDKRVVGMHVLPSLVQDSSQVSRNKRSQMDLGSHLSVENRSEERAADKLIMEENSIRLRGGEREQIDRGVVEHNEARKSTHMFREVSEAHSDNMEFKSYVVQSSIPDKTDKGIQVEMHDACYDPIEMPTFNANSIAHANKQAYLLFDARMESESDTSEFHLTRSNNRRISNSHETYNSRIENERKNFSSETASLVLTREEIQRSSLSGENSQSKSVEMTSTGSLHGISSLQTTNSELNYDAGLIVGELQKEVVSLKESGKTPNVSIGFQIEKPGRRDVQLTLRIDDQKETSSTVLTQERDERQSSLLVGESSQYKTMKIASTGPLDDVSSYVKKYSEVDNHSSWDGIRHIKRLDKSSAFHVDEFVDEIQQEIISLNASEKDTNVFTRFQIEETGRRDDQGTVLTESIEYEDSRDIKEAERSEETGMVQILSSQETSIAEEPAENFPTSGEMVLKTPLETAISSRSPKSLWSYVADIIRFNWTLRGHSHNSASKSYKRTSSNDSLVSEAWFSGSEPDEDGTGEVTQNTKKTSLLESGLVKESVKLPLQESIKADTLTVIEPNSSISSGFMTVGLSDRTASFSAEAENTLDSKSSQGTLSSVAIVEQSSEFDAALPSITDLVESSSRDKVKVLKPCLTYPAAVIRVGFSSSKTQVTGVETAQVGEGTDSSLEIFEKPLVSTVESALPRITDTEEADKPGSIPKLELDPFREKLPKVGGTKEAGIKQRKFQRNKQVLSEQFDEWEEAFKRENEQKKLDVFFMREAILEAKKGADTWEVPVGAVLVQKGRIIARGCNLVEELRDSTAHAEMICIREASNFLRNWRLAETTLYVTLEPCPMCAGAILQARIDTVVWGAPNRLLGADGSWVRLFPGGDGGSSSMNPPGQMVGPVHPFHSKMTIRRGVLETECGDVMQQFFKLRRKKDKKPESSSPPSNLPISNRPMKFFSKLHNIFTLMFCL